jgi:hypothetical protein
MKGELASCPFRSSPCREVRAAQEGIAIPVMQRMDRAPDPAVGRLRKVAARRPEWECAPSTSGVGRDSGGYADLQGTSEKASE